MANNNDITVIMPVHNLMDDNEKGYFDKAVKSVSVQQTIPDEFMVVIDGNNEELKKYVKEEYQFPKNIEGIVNVVENTGETDFCSQMNFGVSQLNTNWFVILEFDDELSEIWIKNVVKYREAHDNVEMFMPIVIDTQYTEEGDNFLGFTNEAVWANEFSDERGILDNGALLRYQNFNLDGLAMKKDVYEEYGGLKPSIKLTFIYEFFLRMTYNDVRVMTIPKFGYKHRNQRDNSLFVQYRNELTPDEANWWLSQAKKEYFFTKDREISYND